MAYLELFCHDPFPGPWKYDLTPFCPGLYIGPERTVVMVQGSKSRTTLIPTVLASYELEAFAEELLFRSACLNKPMLEKHIGFYMTVVLDVEFSKVVHVRGMNVAVPPSEYLGRWCDGGPNLHNLFLFNSHAVVPVI